MRFVLYKQYWLLHNTDAVCMPASVANSCRLLQAQSPWSLPTVKNYLVAKYQQQKHTLSKAALSAHLGRRMTYEMLTQALDLTLAHPSIEWGLLLRLQFYGCAPRRAAVQTCGP